MTGAAPRRPSPAAWVLIAPIRFYQRFITPYTPATCRFYPTCSSYAVTALREYGALRGTWLTLRRLGRCHPWSEGGIDYVPPRRPRREPRRADVSSQGSSSVQPVNRPAPDPRSAVASDSRLAAESDSRLAAVSDSRLAAPTDRSPAA